MIYGLNAGCGSHQHQRGENWVVLVNGEMRSVDHGPSDFLNLLVDAFTSENGKTCKTAVPF